MESISHANFCGQLVSKAELSEIIDITATFPNLSRTELANTVCELLSWMRPSGKLKTVECRQFLEKLEDDGVLRLPKSRQPNVSKRSSTIQRTPEADRPTPMTSSLKALLPIELTRVENLEQRKRWYDYIERYHYLGYKKPFGAQLRYFIKSVPRGEILGCFQFSSPAWRMSPRDQWIGWTDNQRKDNLQKIINNSRFLIFPWIHVKNLASMALAKAAKDVPADWHRIYGYRPVLMETLVDCKKFKGTCYTAANWIHMGQTTGRGRMDRENKNHGAAIKDIFVYPLSACFRHELTGGQ
jgi:hypothetical protein